MLVNQAILTFFRQGEKYILDILFPVRCLGCGKKGTWICNTCETNIPLRLEQHCPACLQHITPLGQICFSCRDCASPALDGVFVASYYRDSLLPHAIHTLKYRFIPDIALPLSGFLSSTLKKTDVPLPDVIIPVPLHRRRLKFRGFNQSELLAQGLSHTLTPGLEIPLLTSVLLRTRYTKPQMKTDSRAERLANLKDAFAFAPGKENQISGKNCWLVDDVATTGTTLEECASILKQHGARSVFGIVLAR